MMRAEDDVVKFFFESLRKHMKKKDTAGIGITILNNRMMNQGWRPAIPIGLYPSLAKLIESCWSNNPDDRPDFDQILTTLAGDVALEVKNMEEPEVYKQLATDRRFSTDGIPNLSTNRNSDEEGAGSEAEAPPRVVDELKKRIAELEAEVDTLRCYRSPSKGGAEGKT